jgi:iron complex outermembrane receptor protein
VTRYNSEKMTGRSKPIRRRRAVRSLQIFFVFSAAFACRAQTQQPNPALQDSLKGLSLEQLGNVEVTTVSKSPVLLNRTAAAVYVITQQEIRRSGAVNLPEALRLAPGLEVAQIDGVKWAVGIRGFEGRLSRAVLVLIDGRSVYNPLFHGVYWEVQDTLMEDIDRIEVVRGPGGTIWGPDAVDGVINIITKNTRDTHDALVSAGGGDVTQGFLNLRYGGGNDKNVSYRVYAKGSTTGPEFHSDHNEFDDQRRIQGGFRADWDITGRDSLTMQGDAYDSLAGESVRVTSLSPPFSTVVNKNAELSGANLLARWKRILSGRSEIQIQMYYDRVNRLQPNQAEHRDTWDFDLVHHLTLSRRQDFIWGFGARISPADLPLVVPTYVFTPGSRTDQLYSAFAQDEISLVRNRLSLTIGAKLFHSSFSGFNTEPSVRLLWTPTGHQTFWAAVTRAVRTPSDNEVTLQTTTLRSTDPLAFNVTTGDGLFTSETDVSYEVGYRQLIIPSFSVDLATFYNHYNHLESLEPGPPYTATTGGETYTINPSVNRNGLLGTTKGFEIAPSWKPTTWWRIQGSYSYLDMDLRTKPGSTDTTTVTTEDAASPRHQFGLQSYLDLPGHFEFTQVFRYVSALGAELTPDYETADLRIAWHAIPHLEFAVTAQNLLQPRHIEYGGDPGPLVGIKRNILAAITWRK